MRLSTFLTIASVLALVFGLAFALAAAPMLSQYGVQPDPATILMARFLGVTLIQLGLVILLARRVAEPTAQRAIVLGSFVGSIAGLAVAISGQLSGVVNPLGWSTVLIYLLLTVGYGYFLSVAQTTR